MPGPLERRFRDSTRGRIVDLLRGASQTVDELAAALALTDNAVRAHLATLERDGLVMQEGTRKGLAGKPAVIYALAPNASALLSRAYAPLLAAILAELDERLSADARRTLMNAAGRRLAAAHRKPAGSLRDRVEAGARLLVELGGIATAERQNDRWVIAGVSGGCPLATVVSDHRDACGAVESLLSDYIGVPVVEKCARGGRAPACRFEVDRTTA